LEEAAKYALSHPPDHQISDDIGRNDQRFTPDQDYGRGVGRRVAELPKRDPVDGSDLIAQHQKWPLIQSEDKGSDSNRRKGNGPRNHVVECPQRLSIGQSEPNLFRGFADRGLEQTGITRFLASPRQANVPGPGIVNPFSSSDQQQGIRIRREDERDRRPRPLRVIRPDRLVPGELLRQPGEGGRNLVQWLWEWQAPPQQPPPGGGPSLLKSAAFPPEPWRAGTDISRSTFRPEHLGQATLVPWRTNCSKSVPQEGQ